jgi:chromosome segregation ATPase
MIAVSLMVSVCILSWTFSLPFRTNPSVNELKNQRLNLAESIQQKRTRAEQIRDDAFADHQQLVRVMNQQQQSNAQKPGIMASRRRWDRKVAKVKNQLRSLGNPPEGSIQWLQKQRLLSLIDDGPQ